MPDPVAQSIAFLKRRIEQDQTALSQLELSQLHPLTAIPAPDPLVVLVRLVLLGRPAGQPMPRQPRWRMSRSLLLSGRLGARASGHRPSEHT